MSRGESNANGVLIVAGLVALAVVFGALFAVTDAIRAASIPIWGMTVGGIAWVLRGPLGKALSRRIAGEEPGAIPPELPGEILGELDELRHRVLELEERVDFSERLLASNGVRAGGESPGA